MRAREKKWMAVIGLAAARALTGCGVPREAATLSAAQAAASEPADDAGVRAALQGQATAWHQMATLSGQKAFGGIGGVDVRFGQLAAEAAALAQRDAELIAQGADSPADDRAALEAFRALWQQTNRYLNP